MGRLKEEHLKQQENKMKTQFMNLFFNDKFEKTKEIAYKERKSLHFGEGKAYPFMQNNNFISKEDIVINAGEPMMISLWLNDKDNKQYITFKIQKKEDNQEFKPTRKPSFDDSPF